MGIHSFPALFEALRPTRGIDVGQGGGPIWNGGHASARWLAEGPKRKATRSFAGALQTKLRYPNAR
jgi:hypothetical protein